MESAARVAFVVLLTACGPGRTVDAQRAAVTFDRVTLDTGGVHGLSGLAVDADGALWTVAERGKAVFRVELDGTRVHAITRHDVLIEDGRDLESLAWQGGQMWAGLETRGDAVEIVALVPNPDGNGDHYRTIPFAEITSAEAGTRVGDNHGVEGLCIAGDWLLAAVEAAGSDAAGRWAPLAMIARGAADGNRRIFRLRLSSATGKISGLDCRRDAAGKIEVIAIERHFEVTRLLYFAFDPASPLVKDPDVDIVPRIALDLGPTLRGALNLEGIAWLPDGRVALVVDNQYGRITGPDELLLLKNPL
jgi:hypothetical protein